MILISHADLMLLVIGVGHSTFDSCDLEVFGMLKSHSSANLTAFLGLFSAVALLASCQSDSPRPPAQNLQPFAQVVGSQPVDTSAVLQKRNTRTYPTFDGRLTAASEQMSDAEAQEMESSLSGLGARNQRGAGSQAAYDRQVEELRKLGAETRP
jgi:hypothetical protein